MDLVPFRDTASYQTEPMGETVKSFNMAITVVYVPMSENKEEIYVLWYGESYKKLSL